MHIQISSYLIFNDAQSHIFYKITNSCYNANLLYAFDIILIKMCLKMHKNLKYPLQELCSILWGIDESIIRCIFAVMLLYTLCYNLQ